MSAASLPLGAPGIKPPPAPRRRLLDGLSSLLYTRKGLWIGILLLPPLLWLVLDRRFVAREERFLRASLGPAYDDYCRRVRRWL